MLYDSLLRDYGANKPIFVSQVAYGSMTKNNIRQKIMNYTARGKLKKYDTGIYYIPAKSIFKSGSQLSQSDVIERKYHDKKIYIDLHTGIQKRLSAKTG